MGEKLLSAPMIEALCEFRFTPSSPWDWTLPGRLYDQIGNEFTERSQVDAVGVQIQLGPRKSTFFSDNKGTRPCPNKTCGWICNGADWSSSFSH